MAGDRLSTRWYCQDGAPDTATCTLTMEGVPWPALVRKTVPDLRNIFQMGRLFDQIAEDG